MRQTNEIIDHRLKDRPISRVDDFINSTTKLHFKCHDCGYIWKTTSHSVLNNKSGCARCVGKQRLTDEIIDHRLLGRSIERVESYINKAKSSKLSFKCKVCSHIWNVRVHHILDDESGCPLCSGKLKLTNEIVDRRLLSRNIRRVDDYVHGKSGVTFECLSCHNTWKASPGGILYAKSGCPKCRFRESKNEIIIGRILSEMNIAYCLK